MQTRLTFFGTSYDSAQGTIRGIIAWLVLILLNLKTVFKRPRSLIPLFLLCCALGVQTSPASIGEAIMYGGLVGVVVYGAISTSCQHPQTRTLPDVVTPVMWGAATCALTSAVLYMTYWNAENGSSSLVPER